MKKILALLLALVMVFALAACGGGGDTPSGTEAPSEDGGKVVKIGVFEPLTGDSGAGGKQEYLGMQYANYLTPTVEIGGEEYTVELVPADNASSADRAPHRRGPAGLRGRQHRPRHLRLFRRHRRGPDLRAGSDPGHRRHLHQPAGH